MMGPSFLCIGAAKSGTSWLHANLKSHPSLWLPPVKELNCLGEIVSGRRLGRPFVLHDVYARRRVGWYARHQLRRLQQGLLPRDLAWALRYFLFPTSEDWYRSLFPADGRVSGECTPSYSVLPTETVERIHAAFPDLKIIYLLRNPVHRDWSHTAMWLGRTWREGKKVSEATEAEISHEIKAVGRSGDSDYIANLERWEQFFARDRFFVGFFEEIEQNPIDLLVRIYAFLEIEASEQHIRRWVGKRVGTGRYSGIPDRYAALLSERNYGSILRAHDRFANTYTQGWVDYAKRHAAMGAAGGGE